MNGLSSCAAFCNRPFSGVERDKYSELAFLTQELFILSIGLGSFDSETTKFIQSFNISACS
jgi:hypothetical protein